MFFQTVVSIMLAILLFSFSSAVEANDPDIQFISSDENGFTLELTLPPFEIETIQTTEQPCHRIHLPLFPRTLEQGYPTPVKGVLMQVPQYGDIYTQVIEGQQEIIDNVDLCPVPEQRVSDDGKITSQFVRKMQVYQRRDFFPDALLEVGTRAILRGIPVSRLRIFPFQWNPLTQELRYFNQIRLQVQFEEPLPQWAVRAKSAERLGVYETLLQRTIINYQGQPILPPLQPATESGLLLNKTSRRVRQEDSEETTRHVKTSDALRIEITEAGIYRVSYDDLAAAGLQPQWMNPERLHLVNQGKEVAIQVISEAQTQLAPGDYLQFYAQGFDNAFTNTNVYWLYWRKKGVGKRLAQIDGGVTGHGEKIKAFYERLHFEQNPQFWLETPGAPEQDYWFWQRLNALEVGEYTFDVPSPFLEPTEAIVRLRFQGRSISPHHPNHHTVIKLNGTVIGDEFWDGNVEHTQEMRGSSAFLKAGSNTLAVEMPGDTGATADVIFVNWIEVDYWRNLEAVKDSLVLTVNGNGSIQVTVNKLSQPDIRIYDITHPFDVAEVINFSVEGASPDYQVTFETPAIGKKTYYISTTHQIKSPPSLTRWKPTKLKSVKNGADYILITAKAFLPAVQPLAELRRRQGLRVKTVSVEDIYHEFNNGLFDPNAIKKFLRHAYHHWSRPAPTYVFLVGDASMNYKNVARNKNNQVPTHLTGGLKDGLTPDDNWYVSVDGDDRLPDMLIGRIPGNSPEIVAELIDKISRFEEASYQNPRQVLLVADSHSQFEALNEGLINFLPVGFQPDKVYLRSYFNNATREELEAKMAEATQDIMSSINEGVMISNYIGHGVLDRWSALQGLFKPADVQMLSNEEQLTFVITLTCINGYFVDPNKYSLAEEFLLAPGGAIGVFAPSNLSYVWEDEILAAQVFSSIFEQGNRILGAITTQSKIAAYERGTSQNVVNMFTLFGDPAVRLKDWQK